MNPTYDFQEPVEETATNLSKIILQRFVDNKEDLVFKMTGRTPEMDAELTEKATDFAIGIAQLVATTDLPADYATYPIEKLITMLTMTKNYIDGSIRQIEDEYVSRSYGVKSPKTDKYARDCITLGELYLRLEDVREKTGGNPDDYFLPKK